MKRRNVVKGIFLFSLGTPLLFSCSDPFKAVKSLGLDKLNFNNDQLSFIDKMSTTILPIQKIEALAQHTTLPFIMKTINDLYAKKDRDLMEDIYTNASSYMQEVLKFDTTNEDPLTWENMIVQLNEMSKEMPSEENSTPYKLFKFYNILKSENLQYLRTSQYIQENYRYYELVPGRYDGNFPIAELPKIKETHGE